MRAAVAYGFVLNKLQKEGRPPLQKGLPPELLIGVSVMKKVKPKPLTVSKGAKIIYVPDAVSAYMIRQAQWDNYYAKNKEVLEAAALNEMRRLWQAKFRRFEDVET